MTEDSEKVLGYSALDDGLAGGDAASPAGDVRERLRPFKELMLSLEWEMTPSTLAAVERELAGLANEYGGDRVVAGLCRILQALARYLASAGAKAHPAAVKFFFGVYNGLEKVLLTPSLSEAKRNKLLLVAAQRYNLVRKRIAAVKTEVAPPADRPSAASPPQDRTAPEEPAGAGPSPPSAVAETPAAPSTPLAEGDKVVAGEKAPPPPVTPLEGEGAEEGPPPVVPLEGEGVEEAASSTAPSGAEDPEIARRLDAFFGEHPAGGSTSDGVVRLDEQGPETPAGPEQAPSSELEEAVAERLDAFFAEEEERKADDTVRPGELAPPPADRPAPSSAEMRDLVQRGRAFLDQAPVPEDTGSLADDLAAAVGRTESVVGTCLLMVRSLVTAAHRLDDEGLRRCRALVDDVRRYLEECMARGKADLAGFAALVRRYVHFQDEVIFTLTSAAPQSGGGDGDGGGGFVIEDVFIP